jgi:ABC-type siderophore export system fused ATPase/permease subunit
MIFTGATFSAVAANASLNTANALLRSRRHDEEEYYEEEPIATTQQRKTKKIKINGTKKEWITLVILLLALVGAVYLLYISCISLFA